MTFEPQNRTLTLKTASLYMVLNSYLLFAVRLCQRRQMMLALNSSFPGVLSALIPPFHRVCWMQSWSPVQDPRIRIFIDPAHRYPRNLLEDPQPSIRFPPAGQCRPSVRYTEDGKLLKQHEDTNSESDIFLLIGRSSNLLALLSLGFKLIQQGSWWV